MAKLRGPLLSFAAAGTVAKAITYLRQPGQVSAQLPPIPTGDPSSLQLQYRSRFAAAQLAWHQATSAERARWTARAAAHGSSARQDWTRNYIIQRVTAPNIPRMPPT